MKLKDRCVIGDHIQVGEYTEEWYQIRIHPTTFYRRAEMFDEGFRRVKGMYAELDLGQYVSIRFSDKVDLTEFYRLYHEYI